jgi:quercetin dioxygenase-like cupin family protein
MNRKLTATVVALLIAAISVTVALATPALGPVVSTLFARGTLTTAVNANADGVKLRTHGSTDHAVQTLTFGPESSSGWHRHPGVVLVTVKSGTLALYHSDCSRETFTAGQSFWESGPQAIIVRNEDHHDDVVVYASFILPTGAPLRIDMPNPGCAVN